MRKRASIVLATFVVVFFFALSLTMTMAQQSWAGPDPCCNPCPPIVCTVGSGVIVHINGQAFCQPVTEGHSCFRQSCICE